MDSKNVKWLCLLLIALIVLSGCAHSASTDVKNDVVTWGSKYVMNEDAVDYIEINGLARLSSKESITTFLRSIAQGEQVANVKLDVPPPDYKITLFMKNNQTRRFSFWLKRESAMFIDLSETSGYYRLSDDAKSSLLDLIEKAK